MGSPTPRTLAPADHDHAASDTGSPPQPDPNGGSPAKQLPAASTRRQRGSRPDPLDLDAEIAAFIAEMLQQPHEFSREQIQRIRDLLPPL
jgi:hypothetical protein